MEKAVSSPFMTSSVRDGYKFKEKDYVSYYEKESVAEGFDPSRPDEFLIKKEVVEFERVPIKEEINSHRNKVGLKNLLKGIVDSRQMDALIQKTQSRGGFLDATKLPDSQLEMEKLAGSIEKVWDSIPSELKGDLTKEEFIKTLTTEKLRSYVLAEVDRRNKSQESEEK